MKGRIYRTYQSQEEVRAELQRRHAADLPVTYRELMHSKDAEVRDNGVLTGISYNAKETRRPRAGWNL